jgi:ABC-type glycerol-3-phosphate transport system substrate-binding protein
MKAKNVVTFLVILLITFSAPLLLAQKTAIELWHGMGAADGQAMKDLELRFMQRNPQIEIKETVMQWTDLYAKLKVATLSGELPDVVIYHDPNVPEYADVTFKPLDNMEGFNINIIEKTHQSVMKIGGKTYYMPISVVAQCMLYNKTLCKAAGFDPGTTQLTIDKFYEYAKKMTKRTADGKVDTWGAIVPFDYFIVYTGWFSNLASYGGQILTADNKKAAFDTPAGVQALKFYTDLFYTQNAALPMMSWDDAPKVWTSGKAGLFLGVCSWQGGLSGGDVHVGGDGVMGLAAWPYPAGKKSAAMGGYHGLSLTMRGTPVQTKAAWAFIQFLLEKDINAEWGVKGSQLPTVVGAVESDYFKKNGAYLASIGKNVSFVGQPNVKTEEIKAIMMKYIENAIMKKQTPEDAIKEAAAEVNKLLAK